MTGRRYERKLVNNFDEHGWAVVKSPSSGSGTDRDQPDLLVGASWADSPPLAVEAKTTANDSFRITESEADQLCAFAEVFGAVPVIAMYWKGPPGGNTSYGGWWLKHADEVRRSRFENADGGYHLRPRREDREGWASIDELGGGLPTGGGGD